MPRHLRGEVGRAQKKQNNYIAENRLSLWPNYGNRKGGGARPGNENAAKAPAEFRAAIVFSYVIRRRVRWLLAMREAAILERQP